MTRTAQTAPNAAPVAAVAALAAITLFMIASLLSLGTSMDGDPRTDIATASAPAAAANG